MTAAGEIRHMSIEQPRQGELLLELLSEEIPARMQHRAVTDLAGLFRHKLAAAGLPTENVRGYVTPRRLTVVADGIPAFQPDQREERRGPRVGASREAIDGFLRSAGLHSINDCDIRDSAGRGAFYFAVVRRPGRPAAEVLPELIRGAIGELAWPKSMRWPGSSLRWVRPLTSVLCLFDGGVVPLATGWLGGNMPVGRVTRGHRFLAPAELCVDNAADYFEKLKQAHVIIDQDRRRQMISAELDRWAGDLGVAVRQDPVLLEEVTGLAEFPVVLAGTIDADFMSLPPEVLATVMRTHQKYFSCIDPDGAAAPHFLFVADNRAEDGGQTIVAGNERVLRARLTDARFFWDQDRKKRLEDRVEALKDRVYHDKLGSVFDKAERMERLAVLLTQLVFNSYHALAPLKAEVSVPGRTGDNRSALAVPDSCSRSVDGCGLARSVQRAVRLAKADLSTAMVGEFPELEGIMGQYYALNDGEEEAVAAAIAEHYKPVGANDTCPIAEDSVIAALTDKLDTLVAFFAISLVPTGSRDPFALRRCAQGLIRIILENRLRLPLKDALFGAAQIFYRQRIGHSGWNDRVGPLYEQLMTFIIDRLKVHLREQGVRHDLIAAAFAQMEKAEDDLVRLLARVDALRDFVTSKDGLSLLIAYRRAANIVTIEGKRDGRPYSGPVDRVLLRQPEEERLADRLEEVSARAELLLRGEQFREAMLELARLRQPVDEFFDKVTVNTAEPNLRENRLRLLSRIGATMRRVADFSQIEG
jgi:glycyl-tRNA synthetase beta chain